MALKRALRALTLLEFQPWEREFVVGRVQSLYADTKLAENFAFEMNPLVKHARHGPRCVRSRACKPDPPSFNTLNGETDTRKRTVVMLSNWDAPPYKMTLGAVCVFSTKNAKYAGRGRGMNKKNEVPTQPLLAEVEKEKQRMNAALGVEL